MPVVTPAGLFKEELTNIVIVHGDRTDVIQGQEN